MISPLLRDPLNEGRSLNSGDTSGNDMISLTPCAPLNEGRSLNSGDTTNKGKTGGQGGNAQRRPESELRRHAVRVAVALAVLGRSTKAGV